MKAYTPKKTGAKRTIDGVLFECWRIGIMRNEWATADNRITIWRNYNLTGWYAKVDGAFVQSAKVAKPKVFRKIETAARAALKMQKKNKE